MIEEVRNYILITQNLKVDKEINLLTTAQNKAIEIRNNDLNLNRKGVSFNDTI